MTTLPELQRAAVPWRPGLRLLEIGCGVGELTEELVGRGAEVHALEQHPHRAERARQRLGDRARVHVGDGRLGWPDAAPYDVILVGFAVRTVPGAWFRQLADEGVLLVPIGPPDGVQELVRYDRTPWGTRRRTRLGAVRCDPIS